MIVWSKALFPLMKWKQIIPPGQNKLESFRTHKNPEGWPPPRIPVTTRIITCLVGDSELNPLFATGGRSKVFIISSGTGLPGLSLFSGVHDFWFWFRVGGIISKEPWFSQEIQGW